MSQKGQKKLEEYFGGSFAKWLTLPRSLLYGMPDEWKEKMGELLLEYERVYDIELKTRVQYLGEDGKQQKLPTWLADYKNLDPQIIERVTEQTANQVIEEPKKEKKDTQIPIIEEPAVEEPKVEEIIEEPEEVIENRLFKLVVTTEQALNLKETLEKQGFIPFQFDEFKSGLVLGERSFMSVDKGEFYRFVEQKEITYNELLEKYTK